MSESDTINRMFGEVAPRYDLANHILSFGLDRHWRKSLAQMVASLDPEPHLVLDLATGSGDVAFALQEALKPSCRIVGVDFCQPMLDLAEKKKAARKVGENLVFRQGDCLALPFEDGCADAITIAFGVRNLEDRQKGFLEMRRVLRKGGVLFVLEFSLPQSPLRPFLWFHLKWMMPLVAGMVTGKLHAYRYLSRSIRAFPARPALAREIESCGFSDVTWTGLAGPVVAIHRAVAK